MKNLLPFMKLNLQKREKPTIRGKPTLELITIMISRFFGQLLLLNRRRYVAFLKSTKISSATKKADSNSLSKTTTS